VGRTAGKIIASVSGARLPSLLVALLILVLTVQFARLVWAVFAPVGPIGDWQSQTVARVASGPTDAAFDPFFRLQAAAGPVQVTSLSLKLFGVRVDSATGRGSAIIATPDGQQSSFAVGEDVMPGVRLVKVDFDGVTIERGGASEQIFLDQSVAAPLISPAGGGAAQQAGGNKLEDSVTFLPQTENGKVTGLILSPAGDGMNFKAWGLQRGDILRSINGKPVAQSDAAAAFHSASGTINLEVERGGRRVMLSAKMGI
jgi:general secretion pathway protein C